MYWIILAIFAILMIGCFILDGTGNGTDGVLSLVTVAFFIITIFVGLMTLPSSYIDVKSIDEQIQIVEDTNRELEEEITAVITYYVKHEEKTYSELKPNLDSANIIAIANTYPELKSSNLIQEQVKTLKDNKKKVVKLKQKSIKEKVSLKFWTFIKC